MGSGKEGLLERESLWGVERLAGEGEAMPGVVWLVWLVWLVVRLRLPGHPPISFGMP